MINVKVSKNEIYQGKLSNFDFEITCNAKYWWSCILSLSYSVAVERKRLQILKNLVTYKGQLLTRI